MKNKLEQVGIDVTYVPANVRFNPADRELGVVTSWNESYIFVNYGSGTSQATRREDLQLGNQTWPKS